MMIGITMPDSGTVSIFDKPFARKALSRIGYLPEERGLYKKMNVLDQLVFFGRLHYLSASVAEQRARAWSERLHITEALTKKTEDLSKGMQQKIQFIAALLHDPDLIIMDEPFSLSLIHIYFTMASATRSHAPKSSFGSIRIQTPRNSSSSPKPH